MNFTCKRVAHVLLATGLLAVLALSVHRRDFVPVAFFAAVAGLLLLIYTRVRTLIAAACRPAQDAYSEGYESGYDKGWREGRQATSLRVVSMRGTSDAVDRGIAIRPL